MLWPRIILVFAMLVDLSCAFAQSVPVYDQRVIGILTTFYNDDQDVISKDSLVYSYSGNRSSVFKAYDYNTSNYHYGFQSSYNPDLSELADMPEPSNDVQRLNVQFDKFAYYQVTPFNKIYNFNTYHTAAYKENNVTRLDRQSSPSSSQVYRRIVERANNGLILSVTTVDIDNAQGTWDTVYRRIAGYDNKLRVVSDSIFSINGYNKSLSYKYVYDPEGRVTALQQFYSEDRKKWTYIRQYLLGYDNNGNYNSWIHLQANSVTSVWDTISKTTWNYDSQGRLLGRYYRNASGVRLIESSYTMHYNDEGDIDTLTYKQDHQFEELQKVIFYYNEHHNPDSAYVYESSGGRYRDNPSAITKYYYEEYNDDSVYRPRPPEKEVLIFPNPSNGTITIRWNDKKPSAPVYVLLYAPNGQFVRKEYIKDIAPDNTVNFTGIASGIYYLRITTQSGGLLHTETVSLANDSR